MRPTRSHSGQHLVQGVVHLSSLFRVERVHGAHQNLERIARKRFLTFARQSQTAIDDYGDARWPSQASMALTHQAKPG
jgi:hypothetical protein